MTREVSVFCASQRAEDVRHLLFRQRIVIVIFEANETVNVLITCKLLGKISTLCAGERLDSSKVALEKGSQNGLLKRHGRQVLSGCSN